MGEPIRAVVQHSIWGLDTVLDAFASQRPVLPSGAVNSASIVKRSGVSTVRLSPVITHGVSALDSVYARKNSTPPATIPATTMEARNICVFMARGA